uniref:Uncharacterized protein n=1 Tax=Arundo donax TaxID=35708 RepID=A0A0A9BGU3_ARUDO
MPTDLSDHSPWPIGTMTDCPMDGCGAFPEGSKDEWYVCRTSMSSRAYGGVGGF